MNVKVLQEILGHKDISTTLDIYTDVTNETKQKEIVSLENILAEFAI